jgi:predicted RNA-binding Zn ribbon-like protein
VVEANMQTPTFAMRGGELCLDFANTVGSRTGNNKYEHLNSYANLLAWSRQAGAVTDQEAQQLNGEATRRPSEAAVVLEKAITLREAIYRIFSAVASGNQPQASDLDVLNAVLAEAMSQVRVVPTGDGFIWEWTKDTGALDRVLWPIARSAADFLTTGELNRVRECSGDTCGWLFVDMSRNRSRRWCDMQDCGNVAKVRRFRQRQHSHDTPSE